MSTRRDYDKIVCVCDNYPGMHSLQNDCGNVMFIPNEEEKHFQKECGHIDVIEGVCSSCGLVIVLCDCEDWKEKNSHVVHQYDIEKGCQVDGPDTRAEDYLGDDWRLDFPSRC